MINVFTDGACSNNGKINAKAGMGIFIPELNIKISKLVVGKQTNNVAELSAIIEVFNILKDKLNNEIIIYTDSKISLGWCTYTGKKYDDMNWIKKNGTIPNVKLIKIAYNLFNIYKNVSIKHIKAHTGKDDFYSKGNEEADRLANIAFGVNVSKKIHNKTYINVSFQQKDIAKSYGARWDPKKKKWYYENNSSIENINKLNELFN
jgi:ribonuclease HI